MKVKYLPIVIVFLVTILVGLGVHAETVKEGQDIFIQAFASLVSAGCAGAIVAGVMIALGIKVDPS